MRLERGGPLKLAWGQRTSGFSQKLRAHPEWFNESGIIAAIIRTLQLLWSQISGRFDFSVVPVPVVTTFRSFWLFFSRFRFRSLQTKEIKKGKQFGAQSFKKTSFLINFALLLRKYLLFARKVQKEKKRMPIIVRVVSVITSPRNYAWLGLITS